MKNRESEEMYLETILLMKNTKSVLRSIDIVNELNYSRASVSIAVKKLIEKEYITVNSLGEISFTARGEARAKEVYERHCVITKVLMMLGASRETAEDNACSIEHVVTDELMEVLKNYLNNNK